MDFGYTSYKDETSKEEVKLPFPASLLTELAASNDIDIEYLSVSNMEQLFTKLVKLWLIGAVSTEDLSSVANYFLSLVSDKHGQLYSRLLDASELSYYIRFPSQTSHEPLHVFVSRLREYQNATDVKK